MDLSAVPKYVRQIELGHRFVTPRGIEYRFTPESIALLGTFLGTRDKIIDPISGLRSTVEELVLNYIYPGDKYGLAWANTDEYMEDYSNPSVEAFFQMVASSTLRRLEFKKLIESPVDNAFDILPGLVDRCIRVLNNPYLTQLSFGNFFPIWVLRGEDHVQSVALMHIVASRFLAHMNKTLLKLDLFENVDILNLEWVLEGKPSLIVDMDYTDLESVKELRNTLKQIDVKLAENRFEWQAKAIAKNRQILDSINGHTATLVHFYWTMESVVNLFLFLKESKRVDELVIGYGTRKDEFSLLRDQDVARSFFLKLATEENSIRLFRLQVDRVGGHFDIIDRINMSVCLLQNPRLNGIFFGGFFFDHNFRLYGSTERLNDMIKVAQAFAGGRISQHLRVLTLFGDTRERGVEDMFDIKSVLQTENGQRQFQLFKRLMASIQSRVSANGSPLHFINYSIFTPEVVQMIYDYVVAER
jgi:hypothetical protein